MKMKTIPTKHSFNHYSVIANEGLLILGYTNTISGYQNQTIWCKCTLRKPMNCVITGELMPIGTIAYRPTTHGQNRGHRMKASELTKYL